MSEKTTFDWREEYAPWIILGVLFVIIDYFVVTPQGIGFANGLIYGFSACVVGLMLYLIDRQEAQNTWAMLLGALIGCFPILASLSATLLSGDTGIYLTVGGLVAVYILANQESVGKRVKEAGLFTLVPMVVWLLWGLVYMHQALTGTSTSFPTLLYRGGVMLFAGWSSLRFLGLVNTDADATAKLSIAFVLLSAFGMLLMGGSLLYGGW